MISQSLQNLNIQKLNAMQEASLSAAKQHDELILLSPTGSGKTLGFLLPILEQLDPQQEGVQALVLAPSRELALQIEGVFRKMGTSYKVNCCYGGHPIRIEQNNLQQPPAVLVGTPGRIADHLQRESFNPATIRTLVLDEFDKALELGFEQEMAFILGQLQGLRKRILTSATNMEQVPQFTGIRTPKILNYLSDTPSQRLTLKAVRATSTDKLEALFVLICTMEAKPALIFCNHREAVERISKLLGQKGIAHGSFQGGMEQEERERELIKFRNGSHRLLICTDLASRGLDIPEIEYVIHYQLPSDDKSFTHRNGRTARMAATGTAYLVLAEEEPLPTYLEEEPLFESLPEAAALPRKAEWATIYIGAGKKDKVNKIDVVGLLLQKGGLQKEELGRIEVLDHSAYAAIKRSKMDSVISKLRHEKIKNKKVKFELSK
ncbi:DEAD/DEAH box helicase [Flammeovirgaceae bacterium 311]|nr:DEAD/DEAH box helicase [Flammeovirgaceae bacterium 311]